MGGLSGAEAPAWGLTGGNGFFCDEGVDRDDLVLGGGVDHVNPGSVAHGLFSTFVTTFL